jgi:hypothetical protein
MYTRWTIFVSFLCVQLYLGYNGSKRRREGFLLVYAGLSGSWACVLLPGGIYLLALAVYAALFEDIALHVPVIFSICGVTACSFFAVCASGARASFQVSETIKSGSLENQERRNRLRPPPVVKVLPAHLAHLRGQECVICLLPEPAVDAGCCHGVCKAGFHARCLEQHFAHRRSWSLEPAELCPVCRTGLSSEPVRRQEKGEEVGLGLCPSVFLSAQDAAVDAEAAQGADAAEATTAEAAEPFMRALQAMEAGAAAGEFKE